MTSYAIIFPSLMCASLFNVLIYFQAFELAEKHPELKVGHVGKKKKKTFLRL